jgi:hypothetical protein
VFHKPGRQDDPDGLFDLMPFEVLAGAVRGQREPLPLMLCGEWPPAPSLGGSRVSLPRARAVRPAGSLIARSPGPLTLGGCGDVEVLRCLSVSSVPGG